MNKHLFLKEKIPGRGSYGTVFGAVSASTHRGGRGDVVAVKATSILPCARSLLKEERILNSFHNCPEIVQCYGCQITLEDGIYVENLILEYAPYGTLADLIRRGAFLESHIREYTRMLLKGLSSIHSKGLVHCDLKPENILVFPSSFGTTTTEVYQLKIVDFGLAKTLEEKKTFDPRIWRFRFRGTPLYMSPESVTMGKIEPALDIWSLGCIVLEMITGLPLISSWEMKYTDEFLDRLVFKSVLPKIPESLSKDCRDFLTKCFDRDYNWRWTAEMLSKHPFLAPPKHSFNI